MAVMDVKTGKLLKYLLNYKQLIHSPKYRKKWATLSKNEFGPLANGVGGRIKNPTNVIRSVRRSDISREKRKDVTYKLFV